MDWLWRLLLEYIIYPINCLINFIYNLLSHKLNQTLNHVYDLLWNKIMMAEFIKVKNGALEV